MADADFSIEAAWDVSSPCYVRKLKKGSHWEDGESPSDRVDSIVEKDFRLDQDGVVSVFQVRSGVDLRRVAVGLNATRDSLSEDIFLIAILPDELQGVLAEPTPGDTKCLWANRLHHNLVVERQSGFTSVVESLIRAGRKPKKFTRSKMRRAVEEARREGCYATRDRATSSDPCVCERGT